MVFPIISLGNKLCLLRHVLYSVVKSIQWVHFRVYFSALQFLFNLFLSTPILQNFHFGICRCCSQISFFSPSAKTDSYLKSSKFLSKAMQISRYLQWKAETHLSNSPTIKMTVQVSSLWWRNYALSISYFHIVPSVQSDRWSGVLYCFSICSQQKF